MQMTKGKYLLIIHGANIFKRNQHWPRPAERGPRMTEPKEHRLIIALKALAEELELMAPKTSGTAAEDLARVVRKLLLVVDK